MPAAASELTALASADESRHPLDGLTADEISTAVSVLRDEKKVDDDTRYPHILLDEPPKERVLAWKKGDELPVIVLAVDNEHRRISLGHKQISENPWDIFETEFGVGTETEGKIVRIIDKGVIVELPQGVDGFVPVSQLSFAPVRVIAFSDPAWSL